MALQLGMLVLDVSDLDESIRFYRLLGMDVPDRFPGRPVTVHTMDSGVSIVLMEGFGALVDPGWTRPTGYQQAMEVYVGNDAAVDELWTKLIDAGYHGRMAPSSPTGVHAAVVDDPDGNPVMISSDPKADPDASRAGENAAPRPTLE